MSNPALAKPALESWETNAAFWDESTGLDGNKYWKLLEEPCLERLLHSKLSQTPCHALEFSTGNGLCARWLAGHGAKVIATDGSKHMIDRAKAYGDVGGHIEFGYVDVTKAEDFAPYIDKAEEIGGFDVILMNMSMHDVATLAPLADVLPRLLKKDGAFVAQLLHPVFMTSTYSRQVDVAFNPSSGESEIRRGKLIKEYLNVAPKKENADPNQPVPQIMFHRPLHEIFGTFFKRGLVLDGIEEPSFTEADANRDRIASTVNFPQLPALMAFRLRRAS